MAAVDNRSGWGAPIVAQTGPFVNDARLGMPGIMAIAAPNSLTVQRILSLTD